MLLKFTRSIDEMMPLLMNGREVKSKDPVYWVFSNVSKKWEHATLICPGDFGGEFPKTFGHYHTTDSIEKYKILYGQGIIVMQKRKFLDDDWVLDQIEKVYLVEFLSGDEINIPPEWGHSCSNIGSGPLLILDDWKGEESYEPIKKLGGLAYFLVNRNGTAEFIPNKNYKNLPKPEWVTASDFNKLSCE